MSVIWTLIVGLFIGLIAKFIMPGRDPGGFIVTMILGVAGAFLGTMLGRGMGLYQEGEAAGFIMSVVGALLLLLVYRLIARKRTLPA